MRTVGNRRRLSGEWKGERDNAKRMREREMSVNEENILFGGWGGRRTRDVRDRRFGDVLKLAATWGRFVGYFISFIRFSLYYANMPGFMYLISSLIYPVMRIDVDQFATKSWRRENLVEFARETLGKPNTKRTSYPIAHSLKSAGRVTNHTNTHSY